MHKCNKHAGRYDFEQLVEANPGLKKFIIKNKFDGEPTVDYFNPIAVKALNKALLMAFYGITFWNLPKGALCPAIPGRADYIHYVSDLEVNGDIFARDKACKCLDVGVGASCIYPIIGSVEYGWTFVGADINNESLVNARKIATSNPVLAHKIELRKQTEPSYKFRNIIKEGEYFDLTICNPPFHESAEAASQEASHKLKKLKGMPVCTSETRSHIFPSESEEKINLNFGGVSNELWCDGGEFCFVRDMIRESMQFKDNVGWFTTLISKERHLDALYNVLKTCGVSEYKTIQMNQGTKNSRILVWKF